MEVRNCRGCGRLFNYLHGQQLCPGCMGELEEKFQNVKEYLRKNPKAPLNKIAEENEVTVKQIKQWVREERLTFTEESQITLECEGCGGKVLTGRFCDRCRTSLQNEFSGAIKRPTATLSPKKNNSEKDRMRFWIIKTADRICRRRAGARSMLFRDISCRYCLSCQNVL